MSHYAEHATGTTIPYKGSDLALLDLPRTIRRHLNSHWQEHGPAVLRCETTTDAYCTGLFNKLKEAVPALPGAILDFAAEFYARRLDPVANSLASAAAI